MPFSTDTNWPQGLLNIFNVSRNRNVPFESRYYGPYDRLFNYVLIEGSFTFFLAPHSVPDEPGVDNSAVFMVVLNAQHKPVLIAEVNGDNWVDEPYYRRKADTQMRQRYDQMQRDCPIPCLYGLSLLGTSLRIYCGDSDTVTPRFVDHPNKDRPLPRDFLKGEWDLDILSPDGLKKMQEIVAYIKAETANVVGQ